jgi:hypothetical protein
MKITKVSKDGNKSCQCGYVFMSGQTAYRSGFDAFNRPVFICDKCKGK